MSLYFIIISIILLHVNQLIHDLKDYISHENSNWMVVALKLDLWLDLGHVSCPSYLNPNLTSPSFPSPCIVLFVRNKPSYLWTPFVYLSFVRFYLIIAGSSIIYSLKIYYIFIFCFLNCNDFKVLINNLTYVYLEKKNSVYPDKANRCHEQKSSFSCSKGIHTILVSFEGHREYVILRGKRVKFYFSDWMWKNHPYFFVQVISSFFR